jgi:hypothetical protein
MQILTSTSRDVLRSLVFGFIMKVPFPLVKVSAWSGCRRPGPFDLGDSLPKYSVHNSARNPQSAVSTLAARIAVAQHEHTRLILEQTSYALLTQLPEGRQFLRRV